ncbi:MAG TPA: hypothetical protein DCS38_06305 [Ruminococcus sp.]|nr:hypothetical protein [Ruminococcus sp.]HBN10808.1 hypothetical protein [Ruminococcus sp.]HCR74215.1 hypothetical protein [Ruminococcus sp.]
MKKILSAVLLSMLITGSFTGCGNSKADSSSSEAQTSAAETVISSESRNKDFDDLDDNNDGILDSGELKDDIDNIGDDVVTIIDDAGNLAEDIVSDVMPGDNDNSDTVSQSITE